MGGWGLRHAPVTLQGKAREAMTQWTSAMPWDAFLTLTDPGLSHPEHMTKRCRYFEATVNRDLYGNNHERRGRGIETLTGIERQERGSVHAHMLLRFPDHDIRDRDQVSLAYLQKKAASLGGFAWLEVPRSQADVVAYVTKYVLKDGDIILGPLFDPNKPRSYRASLLGDLSNDP